MRFIRRKYCSSGGLIKSALNFLQHNSEFLLLSRICLHINHTIVSLRNFRASSVIPWRIIPWKGILFWNFYFILTRREDVKKKNGGELSNRDIKDMSNQRNLLLASTCNPKIRIKLCFWWFFLQKSDVNSFVNTTSYSCVKINRLWHKLKSQFSRKFGVYLGVRTCEVFLCLVAVVRVRVYYVDSFVFFVLRHWWVSQVPTPRQSRNLIYQLDQIPWEGCCLVLIFCSFTFHCQNLKFTETHEMMN